MEKEKLIFGNLLVDLRKMKNISQWQLSLLTGFNPTNLRKVEKGKTQAGVSLALRLIIAADGDIGEFFQSLAEKLDLNTSNNLINQNLLQDFVLPSNTNPKAIFGLLYAHTRKKIQVSQQDVANKAQYHLRNIYDVENGRQEPGVIVALLLVSALDINIKQFFQKLDELYQESITRNPTK